MRFSDLDGAGSVCGVCRVGFGVRYHLVGLRLPGELPRSFSLAVVIRLIFCGMLKS